MPDATRDFQLLIQRAATAALVADQQGTIQLISNPALKLFGYERSELVGESVERLIPPRMHTDHGHQLTSYFRNPSSRAMGAGRSVTGLHKDGREIAVDISLSPVILGEQLLVAAWIRDDEKQRQMALELQSYRDQLAHMGRVAFASEMVAGIAHELSQPLAASANYAEAMQMFVDSGRTESDEFKQLSQPLVAQILRAGDIVRGLRDFVSGKSPNPTLVKIETLIESAIQFQMNELKLSSIQLEVDVEADLPMIRCVEVQIAQVLDNLIQNAIDALSDLPIERRKIELKAFKDDGYVRIEVTDWGDGICSKASANLFDQFFTTKPDGMGVGLSICKSIVEQHGGLIDLEKTSHGGARFAFTIKEYQKQ